MLSPFLSFDVQKLAAWAGFQTEHGNQAFGLEIGGIEQSDPLLAIDDIEHVVNEFSSFHLTPLLSTELGPFWTGFRH